MVNDIRTIPTNRDTHIAEEHFHSVGFYRPTGAADITLTSGGAPYTLGNYFQIIAAGDITYIYDLHWYVVGAPDTNAKYEIFLYATVRGAARTAIDHFGFTRTNVLDRTFEMAAHTERVDAGSILEARMMDSVGGAQCTLGVRGHPYV